MLESRANEVSEEEYFQAVKFGMDSLKPILLLQEEFVRLYGQAKAQVELKLIDSALMRKIETLSQEKLAKVYKLSKKEELVPSEVTFALLDSENPVRDNVIPD